MKKKQKTMKPRRVDGDPEGYEPVFGKPKELCRRCALLGKHECVTAPCYRFKRPEGEPIFYREAKTPKTQKPRRIYVHVRGGVAYCGNPRVVIVDHDNEK